MASDEASDDQCHEYDTDQNAGPNTEPIAGPTAELDTTQDAGPDDTDISRVCLPRGFAAHVGNIGIKDSTDDFAVIASTVPCNASAVFTRSRFAGPSVTLSRSHASDGRLQAITVISKNANVATGPEGDRNAAELVDLVAQRVGVPAESILVASTGVIGRQYPMDRIRDYLGSGAGAASTAASAVGMTGSAASASSATQLPPLELTETRAIRVAEAIMTTDTHPKVAVATVPTSGTPTTGVGATTVPTTGTGAIARTTTGAPATGESMPATASGGHATIVGVAKGVGMIEPDMATMLTFILTDADIASASLDAIFRRVVERTFNSLSVDTDTSTSDTAVVLANGLSGPVDETAFESALLSVCLDLTRQLAADGEGATKLLTVTVSGARDDAQAKRVAKAIVNSPLVKTAVHGADPNWGRVVMAIGKCSDDTDIDPDAVSVGFGGTEVYPRAIDDAGLVALEDYLRGDEVEISADLGIDDGRWTVYGCDLSDGYVRINADYTT